MLQSSFDLDLPLPYTPPPVQRVKMPKVFAPLRKRSRYKAVFGGRGSGKSHSVATQLVIDGVLARERILCCREIQNSLKDSSKKLIEDKIYELGLQDFYKSTKEGIFGRNGTVFLFIGLRTNISSIKSMEGITRAWVEEAAYVSQRSIDLLKNTLRKKGAELWFTWNPDQKTDPVDKMFRSDDGPPEDTILIEANYTDNPWFWETELPAEMARDKRLDPGKYAHIWLGKYQLRTEAQVFKNWRVAQCMPDDDTILRFGADWGFSITDPTVLIRGFIYGDHTLYIDHEAWRLKCPTHEIPALFNSIPRSKDFPIRADSSRPETIHHCRMNGYPKMQGAIKGAGSIQDGINFLLSYEIVVHPRCEHVIDELTNYCYAIDPLTDEVTSVLADKKNHTIDSIRYMLENVRRNTRVKTSAMTGSY